MWWWWVWNREGGGQGQAQHGVAQRQVVQVARVVVVVGRVLLILVVIGLGLVLVVGPGIRTGLLVLLTRDIWDVLDVRDLLLVALVLRLRLPCLFSVLSLAPHLHPALATSPTCLGGALTIGRVVLVVPGRPGDPGRHVAQRGAKCRTYLGHHTTRSVRGWCAWWWWWCVREGAPTSSWVSLRRCSEARPSADSIARRAGDGGSPAATHGLFT